MSGLKFLGAFLILISGGMIGWINATQYLNRVKEIRQLQLAVNLFNTEISYARTMLPGVLEKISEGVDPPVAIMFAESAAKLMKNSEMTFYEIWKEVIASNFNNNSLKNEDLKIMKEWGQQIAYAAIEDQNRINDLTLNKLKNAEEKAENIAEKRVKLSRYGGIIISLFVIILFY